MNGAQNTHGLSVLDSYVIFMLSVHSNSRTHDIDTIFSRGCFILPWNFGPIPFRRSCGAKDVGQNVNIEQSLDFPILYTTAVGLMTLQLPLTTFTWHHGGLC